MTISVTDGDYLLPAGQILSLTGESGVTYQGVAAAPHSIDIAGAVRIDSFPQPANTPLLINSELDGITTRFSGDFGAARVLIGPTGTIGLDVTGSAHTAVGVFDDSGPELVNQGAISVKADAAAAGVFAGALSVVNAALVDNGGTISVVSTAGAATGVNVSVSGPFENSGRIDVTGFTAAVGVHTMIGVAFDNSGQIEAHQTGNGAPSIAVQYDTPGLVTTATLTNSGLLQGDIALKVVAGLIFPQALVSVLNSGAIVGEVDFSAERTVLSNSGTIIGAVNFGGAADVYDGHAGTETGLVSGGAGNDTLMGGAGFDNLQGNQGDDSESGGAGDDIVVGGQGNDLQVGDDGNDVVWGNLGNDTLDGGAGNDQVRGGQGDDSVSGGAGNDYISGDRGNDTESGGAGADLFHGSQDAGIDRVLDFSQAEGDRVELDPGTTYTLSQVGTDTVIDMGNGNQMILVGVQLSTLKDGWIFESF